MRVHEKAELCKLWPLLEERHVSIDPANTKVKNNCQKCQYLCVIVLSFSKAH